MELHMWDHMELQLELHMELHMDFHLKLHMELHMELYIWAPCGAQVGLTDRDRLFTFPFIKINWKLPYIRKMPALYGFVSRVFLLYGMALHVAGKELKLHGVAQTCW